MPENEGLQYIRVGDLHIADKESGGYQRALELPRVKRMAADWQRRKAKTLIVSLRVGGERSGDYFVVDGQHRHAAARVAEGEDYELLCDVEPMTFEEEAGWFANQDTDEKKVSSVARFEARILSREEKALKMQADIESVGWKITPTYRSTNGSTLGSMPTVERLYDTYTPEVFLRTLRQIDAAYKIGTSSRSDMIVIEGFCYLFYVWPEVHDKELAAKLKTEGLSPLEILANWRTYFNKMNARPRATAKVILAAYNKQRTTTRLDEDRKAPRRGPR